MSTADVRRALDQIGDHFDGQDPPDANELARVLSGLLVPPPEDLRALYEKSEGGYLEDVAIFLLVELESANDEPRYRRDFPSAIFFAGDGGDGWFFIDTDDDMDYGHGAIFWVDRASMTWGRCIPCGGSLAEFLLTVHRGETPWLDNEDLIRQSTEDMLDVLDAYAAEWLGNPPASLDEVYAAAQQIGANIMYPLRELMLKTNGLIFKANGVAIAHVTQFIGIGGLPGTAETVPPAILIGQDQQFQYAITTEIWRSLPGVEAVGEGFLLRLKPGQLIIQAEVLGWLPYVIEDWLEPTLDKEKD